MPMLKSPAAPAQFKADFEQRIIEGYASIFGNVDSVGDVMMPGSFKRTLAQRLPQKLVKSCYNHGPLIGSPIEGTAEDSTGLYTRTKITNNPIGTAVLQDVVDGHVTHMSFAYDVVKRDFIQQENGSAIRQLQEVKLYEYGPVDFPANEQAAILGAKAIADALDEALAGLPELERIWQQKGFLKDRDRDLVHYLTGAITTAITSAVSALSAADPEPNAATTPAGDPPPTAGDDPEGKAYADLSLRLMTFNSQRRLAGLRAAAQG